MKLNFKYSEKAQINFIRIALCSKWLSYTPSCGKSEEKLFNGTMETCIRTKSAIASSTDARFLSLAIFQLFAVSSGSM